MGATKKNRINLALVGTSIGRTKKVKEKELYVRA